MSKITESGLFEAGYKEFRVPPTKTAAKAFQKAIPDDMGNRKYFITVYMYDFSAFSQVPAEHHIRFTAENQFNLKNGDVFDVLLHSDQDKSVEDVESFFKTMWETMGCTMYDN